MVQTKIVDGPLRRGHLKSESGRDHLPRGGGAADDLEQRHDVCRAEKMQPDDVLRAGRRRCDQVDVDRRRVGAKDTTGAAYARQIREYLPLYRAVFEHRLNHQIQVGKFVEAFGNRQKDNHIVRRQRQLALCLGALQLAPDRLDRAFGGIGRIVEQQNLKSGIEACKCDPHAHRPAPDNPYAPHRAEGLGASRRQRLGCPLCRAAQIVAIR